MLFAEKRQETAEVETRLAQRSALGQAGEIAGVAGEGLWNGAVGLIEFFWDTAKTVAEIQQYLSPLKKLNNLLESSYQSYKSGSLTEEKWLQSISDNMAQKELEDLSLVLDFDPRKFDPALVAEAYEITSFIADDEATLKMQTDFARDYAVAQSTLDWAEFAGGGVFEIVLAALMVAFTGGAGIVLRLAASCAMSPATCARSPFPSSGKIAKTEKNLLVS
jgi:hypothetical protein